MAKLDWPSDLMLLRLPDVVNTQHLNCRTARAATLDVQVKPSQGTVRCVVLVGLCKCTLEVQPGNEKRAPGCLGYIWDEILSSYVGSIYVINHSKDPYWTTRSTESEAGFFSWLNWPPCLHETSFTIFLQQEFLIIQKESHHFFWLVKKGRKLESELFWCRTRRWLNWNI